MSKAMYQMDNNEKIIITERALWRKAKINFQPGTLYLSDKRLFFIIDANPFAGILLKVLFKSARSRLTVDIKIASVFNIEQEHYGAHKNILCIAYEQEKVAKFAVKTDIETWRHKIEELKAKL